MSRFDDLGLIFKINMKNFDSVCVFVMLVFLCKRGGRDKRVFISLGISWIGVFSIVKILRGFCISKVEGEY